MQTGPPQEPNIIWANRAKISSNSNKLHSKTMGSKRRKENACKSEWITSTLSSNADQSRISTTYSDSRLMMITTTKIFISQAELAEAAAATEAIPRSHRLSQKSSICKQLLNSLSGPSSLLQSWLRPNLMLVRPLLRLRTKGAA